MNTAPIALSIGEPAGIGPEIIAGAWQALGARCPFFVIADPTHLSGLGVPVAPISSPAEAMTRAGHALPVLPQSFPAPRMPGQPAPENAEAVIAAIARAVDFVMRGEATALVTGPIHKKALQDGAGFRFPGHTEYLAHLAGAKRAVMMLACNTLRVVPTTIHIPLSEVPGALDAALLTDTIRITAAGLQRDFGVASPRIAVSGLNPHAGEGGAMGQEEIKLIAPVVAALRTEGMAVTGPHSADTMFHPPARSRYDAAVMMYHDQALIPIKTLAFDEGVNVTLGLPFIRTSPDHGTGFDIAGRGIASPLSMIAALEMAARMAAGRAAA